MIINKTWFYRFSASRVRHRTAVTLACFPLGSGRKGSVSCSELAHKTFEERGPWEKLSVHSHYPEDRLMWSLLPAQSVSLAKPLSSLGLFPQKTIEEVPEIP